MSDEAGIRAFLAALGRAARESANLYLVGGATAVLYGWRATTIDIDLTLAPERDELLRALPELKRTLGLNLEFSAPHHFIPPLPGWEQRSVFVGRYGKLSVFHYDPYAQALAKIERRHAQDVSDVRRMFADGLISAGQLLELFESIESNLYRYPAIDPADFRTAVEEAIREAEATNGPLT